MAPFRLEWRESTKRVVLGGLIIGIAIVAALACDGRDRSEDDVDADVDVPAIGAECDVPAGEMGNAHTAGLGDAFCLRNPAYPYGYFTMNCETDADCPKDAQCDDGQLCRSPCRSDADCRAPTTCRPHGMPTITFCECGSCIDEM